MRHAELQELFAGIRSLRTIHARDSVTRLRSADALASPGRLERFGFRAYSQSDEDGIIAEIFRRIGVSNRRFIEIGVGNGLENNTAYLLAQGWTGGWIEADRKSVASVRTTFANPIAEGSLSVIESFVTRENVNELIASTKVGADIDFLSIDIDGNDYHVFEVIETVRARVVAIEYNATFRPPIARVQVYDPSHRWNGGNAWGASLSALDTLARARGYRLVGTGLLGINAFFVANEDAERASFAEPATPENLYNPPAYDLIEGLGGGHPAAWQAFRHV